MYTGIIKDLGQISNIYTDEKKAIFTVFSNSANLANLKPADILSVNGKWVRINDIQAQDDNSVILSFEISKYVYEHTSFSRLQLGSTINFEQPLKLGDQIGGHFFMSQIDDIISVIGVEQVNSNGLDFYNYTLTLPQHYQDNIHEKSTIALDGVALTAHNIQDNSFEVHVFQYTYDHTSFGEIHDGDIVNFQLNEIAREIMCPSSWEECIDMSLTIQANYI